MSRSFLNGSTKLVLLIGDPVEHSLSPRIHNTAFATHEINAVYAASQVGANDLRAAVDGLRALRVLGANVTIPHKEEIAPLLDTLTDRARAVGAVNTIVSTPSDTGALRLRGDNTDVAGFLAPIDKANGLDGTRMTILGAGGAARAVAYGLGTTYAPDTLTVAARRPEQAEALLDALSSHLNTTTTTLQAMPLDEAHPAVSASRLVVNATPVGMAPNTNATPWPDAACFTPDHLVYDLVYTPRRTRLLREAEAHGAATQGGLAMLIGQAAAAYKQWTGQSMPIAAVRDEVITNLESSSASSNH